MSLENDLRRELGRRRPPAGFAARVMARVDQEKAARTRPSPRWVPWAVAAALLLSSGGGAGLYQQHQQRVRAEQARDQLLLALKITGTQLAHVNAKVRSITEAE